jgi:hypothetical protein
MVRRVRITEKLKSKYRDKHICIRCNSPFDTEELLQNHRLYSHGEISSVDKLRDIKGKDSFREPPKTDWVIHLSEEKSWWYNPWRHYYYMCVLGVGCISNSLYPDKKDKNRMKEMVICDESTLYFRIWRDILFENQPIRGEPTPRPTMKPLKKETPKDIPLPRSYIYCENCYHIIRIIRGNHYRCKKCYHLITIDENNNSEKYYNTEKQKEVTHRCKNTPIELTDDVLLLCPSCGKNIFKESKDTNVESKQSVNEVKGKNIIRRNQRK